MIAAEPLDPLRFPLFGTRLIEASAGTGKTYAIAALYVRLVLGHGGPQGFPYQRPLLPPEILVVTFTEAATRELRQRIRERLAETARCFRGRSQPQDEFLQALIGEYGELERGICARRLELAVEWMDEAAIHTIHGWCGRMLRQHAFDSGSLFDLRVDAADTELFSEVVRDYWRKFFYPLDQAAVRAVSRVARDPADLLVRLKDLPTPERAEWRMGDTRLETSSCLQELLAEWLEWERCRVEFETSARACWRKARGEIEALLREALRYKRLNGSKYRNLEDRLQTLGAWAEGVRDCKSEWLRDFAQRHIRTNAGKEAPRHAAFERLEVLVDHLKTEPVFEPALLHHAVSWVGKRYAEEKLRRTRMDFDDLVLLLDEALRGDNGERLARILRSQFPVALIDEFQDTDPLQYRIFDAVYRVEQERRDVGLFLIGDPKQSIYSFRGADIHTYLRAKRQTTGRHYTLPCNFRSTESYVEAVNRLFHHAEQHPQGAFRFRSDGGAAPLPFLPVKAQGRPEFLEVDGIPQPALVLWYLDAREPLAKGEYSAAMAQATASEVVRLLNLGRAGRAGFRRDSAWVPLVPSDVAILVRDRREAVEIRAALAARRVPSVYLSDRQSVYASPEARDLLLWLQACAEPGRDRLLRTALATTTLALDYASLDALRRDESLWEREVQRFSEFRRIWRTQGVLPMLRRLLLEFDVPARLLPLPNGERALTNLLHLSELLQTASVRLDGEAALIRHLAEAMRDEGDTPEEHIVRLESDADRVKIVTIHKSKGLEYPLVFLPFACSFRDTFGRSRHCRFRDADGRLVVDLAATEEAKRRADEERLQEELRLFYVALTRARHACWLGIAPVKVGPGSDCQLHRSAVGHVLAGGSNIRTTEIEERLRKLAGECRSIAVRPLPEASPSCYEPPAEKEVLGPARRFDSPPRERWWIASYSALRWDPAGGGLEPQTAEPDPALPADRQAPRLLPGREAWQETARQALLAEACEELTSLGFPATSVGAPWHRFPRGPRPGIFLHGLLEWAAQTGFARASRDWALREETVVRRCRRRGLELWGEPLSDWLVRLLTMELPLPSGVLALCDLDSSKYQVEMEFWFAAQRVDTLQLDRLVREHTLDGEVRPLLSPERLHGMFKGFIDLVFEHGGRYYVADYKSNWLGPDDRAYTAPAMRAAILEKRYDLQYVLYLLALHRLLKVRLPDYDYDCHVGGVVYWFLRGIEAPGRGVFVEKPPRRLLETLDRWFDGMAERPDGP
jgi:exodeoxyribonuclease V beta subunit